MGEKRGYYHEYFERGIAFNSIALFYHQQLLEFLKRLLPDLNAITEIGAGFGYIAHLCLKHKIGYNGIEANPAQAATLRNLGFSVDGASLENVRADFPFNECVYLSHVLEHMDGVNQASRFLHDLTGRQKPGDHLFVVCPDVLDMKGYFWDCDWSHSYPTTLRRTTQLLKECGYQIIQGKHWIGPGWTNPLMVELCRWAVRMIPMRIIDWISCDVFDRTPLGFRFMSAFGWRQFVILARKPV